MKKIFKLLFLVLATCMSISSCSDDDNVAIGQQTNSDSLHVYFNAPSNIVLDASQSEFTVTVERNKDNGNLIVPISGISVDGKDVFNFPETIEFKAGELEAQMTVGVNESIEWFHEYNLQFAIPEQYTCQYKADLAGYPRLSLNVIKEDYKVIAKGIYFSYMFGNPYQEETSMEYSEMLKLYRFKNIVAGQSFTFKVDDNNIISYDWDIIPNGYNHKTYGTMYISPYVDKANGYLSFYDPESSTYYFSFEFTVSAGSFGPAFEGFIVTEKK